MAETWSGFLRRDLREDLATGAARSYGRSPRDASWVAGAAVLWALVGVCLFQVSGYHTGFATLNGLAASTPGWPWQLLSSAGNERVAFALALLFSRRHPRVFWALVAAGLIGAAYTQSLKHLLPADRPPAVLPAGSFTLIGPALRRASFPSGHSVTAALFFGVWMQHARTGPLRGGLMTAAIAVGVSRVAVGVHWPIDVAAGLAGGLFAAWLGVRLAERRPWGLSSQPVHLTFVALAAVLAGGLVFRQGGFEGMSGGEQLLGAVALACFAFSYLIEPAWRWQRRRDGSGRRLDLAAGADTIRLRPPGQAGHN